MNTFTLSGNLTDAPKLHTSESGRKFYSFTVAHNRVWYTAQKEKQTQTSYFDCIDNREGHAKYISDYAEKGSHVVIVGSLSIVTTEKDGTKYKNLKVLVDDIHLTKKQSHSTADNEHPFNN